MIARRGVVRARGARAAPMLQLDRAACLASKGVVVRTHERPGESAAAAFNIERFVVCA
jgi:hypothetical protein